ncbi:MAG: hypothetical protein ABJB74_19910 [Gemmatimonas sp.]
MSPNADVSLIRSFLDRVAKRLGAVAATEGAAAGLILATVLLLLRWSSPFSIAATFAVVLVAVGAGVGARWMMLAAQRRQAARTVERVAPNCHNLVVAADEIMLHPGRVRESVASLVFRQAAAAVRVLDVAALFPVKRALTWLLSSAAALVLVLVVQNTGVASQMAHIDGASNTLPVLSRIDILVEAPAYAAQAAQNLREPSRIVALAGSRVNITVKSNASTVVIETLEKKDTLNSAGNETFSGTIVANADGFVAIEPSNAVGKGTRKLIGLSVTPDHAPQVRLSVPGKDMLFPDGNRSLSVNTEASDDIGLASLKLRYTKVSGSGEQFTFTEGEVPLNVSRDNAVSWKGQTKWDLSALKLDAGDMVVYRAVATDKRPGSLPTESDSYIAEIKQIGSDAAAGFAVDPDQERYALSQQMIIVKTEKLLAKRASVSAQAFADEANDIAVEQRRVRAEFVFMMGGELEDAPVVDEQQDMTTLNETAEAEGEADILDGRGANRGRLALVRAVRHMSNAVTLLNETDVVPALVREKTALKELEQAFAHTRIILRALTQAEKLDMSRRMTGPLVEAGRDVHPVPLAESSTRVVALRNVLAGVAELLGAAKPEHNATQHASELAERVLRVDPSAKPLQEIASRLNEAAAAYGKSNTRDATRALETAAVALTEVLRADLVTAPAVSRAFGTERLDGALTDALRSARNGDGKR